MELNYDNIEKKENNIESQKEWISKLNIIYKLYLNDAMNKNKDNIENCRADVKKFWLDNMSMPPILECYNKPKKSSILELCLE
tara:strand:- start:140 stop:388 length:249 start_codon:yes stop_codon:yes gene_type:complete